MASVTFDIPASSAVVTGASSGIGREIAESFAADGIDVAICSRSQERVDAVADGIEDSDAPGRALAVECDVREEAAVEAFVEETAAAFGGVDVLINNAAGTFRSDFEDLSANAWRTIIDINLHGTFNFTQAVGEEMRAGDGGSIVNFASIAALGPSPRTSHYAASKKGILSLTETLAVEWAEHDIRVNCIAPGLVSTPPVQDRLGITEADMPPRGRVDRQIGTPAEVADIARFLVSEAASYVTGETVVARGVPPVAEEDPL